MVGVEAPSKPHGFLVRAAWLVLGIGPPTGGTDRGLGRLGAVETL